MEIKEALIYPLNGGAVSVMPAGTYVDEQTSQVKPYPEKVQIQYMGKTAKLPLDLFVVLYQHVKGNKELQRVLNLDQGLLEGILS